MIRIAAFLEMSVCGMHGHVVLSNGTRGSEFCSKLEARQEVKMLLHEGLIDVHEASFLDAAIYEDQGLAPIARYADGSAIAACLRINRQIDESEEVEDSESEPEDSSPKVM